MEERPVLTRLKKFLIYFTILLTYLLKDRKRIFPSPTPWGGEDRIP